MMDHCPGNPFEEEEDSVSLKSNGKTSTDGVVKQTVSSDYCHGNPFEEEEEDSVSIKSNGKTSTGGFVKGTMSRMRLSIRHMVKKSPLKREGTESGSTSPRPPPSPSLSSGSTASSPMKAIGGFFQKKEEDEGESSPHKLSRSKTDPNMSSRICGSLKKKFFQSLRLDPKVKSKEDPVVTVAEGPVEEQHEEDEEEEEEEEFEEMEESYILPELPLTPLSVMQINKLIEMEVLEEAHLNLLAMRREFGQEQQLCADDSTVELAKKEKDLNLLYENLRKKITDIVRDSNTLPARNKGLLVHVVRIIQEEVKRAEEPGGLQDSWMEAWREAVAEGVHKKVESVHLDQREKNTSWLAIHLGLLGQAIVQDLKNVRKELRWSYPPSFKVFSTYVNSYHRVVGGHLTKLEQQVTELKDLYSLLDWIINRYKSEKIMGSLSLESDMQGEKTELQLEENFLKQLKDKYCCKLKEDMKASLERIIELENKEVWQDREEPRKDDNFPSSQFPMDIWTQVKSYMKNSETIDAQLKQNVISSCMEELKQFPKRFELEFKRHCDSLKPQPLWTHYHIAYINSFTALQQHMENYQDSCPGGVEGFRKEVKWLIVRLMEDLEDHFKEDVKPYLRRMMTRKWMTNDDDFQQLYSRTGQLSNNCKLMTPPHVQDFASRLHYHVAREYIGQLMKNNYSCKNRKHEAAATKIRQQWSKLRDLFDDMESTHEWLRPAGDDLCNIIGQRNKADIKNNLQPLIEHYPDFREEYVSKEFGLASHDEDVSFRAGSSRKHLVAVLSFRGLQRGREYQLILQKHSTLKKETPSSTDKSRLLFNDMQVTVNRDCLSSLPFSCLSFLPGN